MTADPVRPRPAGRRALRVWMKKAVQSIAATLLVLLGIEAVVRVAKTLRDDWAISSDQWLVTSGELGWSLRPRFDGIALTTPRTFDADGYFTIDTAQVADGSLPRIICLGDSNTFGWGVDAGATFAELVDRRLPTMDVLNLGVIGYSSFQGLRVLKGRGLDLEPAVVIASFNHNDRSYILPDSQVDSLEKFAAIYRDRWRKQALAHVYLLRAGAHGLRKLGWLRDDQAGSEKLDLGTLRSRVPPESYRANLTEMVELTRARNIQLVFILLKDNPALSGYLREGIEALERGDHDQAIDRLSAAVELENGFSDLARLYLSRAYEAIGEHQLAVDVRTLDWRIDSSLGGRPIYLDTDYNRIMTEVAEQHSVPLVDAGSILNTLRDIYSDAVHPNERGHRIIADLLYEELASCCLGAD